MFMFYATNVETDEVIEIGFTQEELAGIDAWEIEEYVDEIIDLETRNGLFEIDDYHAVMDDILDRMGV